MSAPLQGVRVIDASTVVMGPWAAQMLADMGAEVIKVEAPGGDIARGMGPHRNPGMAAVFLCINRNKRSIVLDLQQPAGREALLRLAQDADVLLHNMRPKVSRKLGLDYAAFARTHPRLVYCGAYGFRKDGPLADEPAYDDIIQAASGLAHLMGMVSDQPRFVPSIVADKTSAYAVVTAVQAALLERVRTGRGQPVEVGMFETLVDFALVEHLYGAAFVPPIGGMGYARLLTRQRRPYPTRDGYLAVLPYTDRNWRDFFHVAGRGELAARPEFANVTARVRHADLLYATAAEIVATRTTAEWLQALGPLQIPVMPVRAIEDLLEDEQLRASGFWQEYEHPTEGRLRMTTPPVRYGSALPGLRRPPPRLGEHSAEILAEIGYTPQQIAGLFEAGVTAGG